MVSVLCQAYNSWWSHDIETLSASLVLCEGKQQSQWILFDIFFYISLKKSEQTVKLLVIWDVLMLKWGHCIVTVVSWLVRRKYAVSFVSSSLFQLQLCVTQQWKIKIHCYHICIHTAIKSMSGCSSQFNYMFFWAQICSWYIWGVFCGFKVWPIPTLWLAQQQCQSNRYMMIPL